MEEWLSCRDGAERALVYSKFVAQCEKRVEAIMESFVASHLSHQEYGASCLIVDPEIDIYYTPLMDSLGEEAPDVLVGKLKQQESLRREWENLNYLSSAEEMEGVRITVPMACLLTYKAFQFYCRSSTEAVAHKMTPTTSMDHLHLIQKLEEQLHLRVAGRNEDLFEMEVEGRKMLFFNRIGFLPELSAGVPVSMQYIKRYIKKGVVSTTRDIQAISVHISDNLLAQVAERLQQR